MKLNKSLGKWIKHKIIIIITSIILLGIFSTNDVVNANESERVDVNLIVLGNAIERAKSVDRTGRTQFTIEQLDNVLGLAIDIYLNPTSVQKDVDEILFSLERAVDNLLYIPSDKSNLYQAIQAALQLNKVNKTNDSLERLYQAITKGEQLMSTEGNSQLEIDMATEDIENGIKGLTDYPVYQVDRTQLNAIINKALQMKDTISQADILNRLVEAIRKGEVVFHSSMSTQAEIDQATTQINIILNEIIQKPSELVEEVIVEKIENKEVEKTVDFPEVNKNTIKKEINEKEKEIVVKQQKKLNETALLSDDNKYKLPSTTTQNQTPVLISMILLFIGFVLRLTKRRIV